VVVDGCQSSTTDSFHHTAYCGRHNALDTIGHFTTYSSDSIFEATRSHDIPQSSMVRI